MQSIDIISELKMVLSGMTKVSPYVYNSRCPVCGDSKSKKSKKRFYILLKKEVVYCHNCGYSSSIKRFIREYFPDIQSKLFRDSSVEAIRNKSFERKSIVENIKSSTKIKVKTEWLEKAAEKYGLVKTNLPQIAEDFIEKRGLRKRDHGEIWYIEDFFGLSAFVNSIKDKKPELKAKGFDPRIFIPFFDNDGILYAAQGRALYETQSPKYLTVLPNESKPKLYNVFSVDKNSTIYVLEGPIDSMFVKNSVATAGSNSTESVRQFLSEVNKKVYVFDRDFSYNWDVRIAMKKAVSNGETVFIHPPEFGSCKDINDYVLKTGATCEEITDMIDKNSFSGVVAAARMAVFRSREGDGRRQKARYSSSRRPLRS